MTDVERLDRLEAIARANRLHEPACALLITLKRQEQTGAYLVRPTCDCWLAVDEEDAT